MGMPLKRPLCAVTAFFRSRGVFQVGGNVLAEETVVAPLPDILFDEGKVGFPMAGILYFQYGLVSSVLVLVFGINFLLVGFGCVAPLEYSHQ